MAATADQRATAGVVAALRKGPLDVLGLLTVLRPVLSAVLSGHEGSFHVLLHQLVRRGRLAVDGCTERGLAQYVLAADRAPHGAPELPGTAPAGPSPTDPFAREGERLGAAARDPKDRARIASDVAAHLTALGAEGRSDFGPARSIRHHIRRVDRGRPTVIFATGPGEGLKRVILHEGPWLLAAVVVFFVVRAFLAEVFVIPSGSMIPTLLPRDRVIVVKPGGSGMPERWRIATFERSSVTYVKRAVGLGGEAFALIDGDVYADGELLVKPDDVREALRFPYRQWDLQHREDVADWARTTAEDGSETWTWAGPPLWSAGILHPRRPSADVHLRDVYATLTAERPEGGSVELALDYAQSDDTSTGDEVTLVLVVGGDGAVRVETERAGQRVPAATIESAVQAGRVTLALSVVDGVWRAAIGGLEVQGLLDLKPGLVVTPRLSVSGDAQPLELMLDKDIHYSLAGQLAVPGHLSDEAPGSYAFRIPDGHVFFLGDNTHDSRDSRYRDMGPVDADALIGPVSLRIWPLSRIGFVR